MTLPRPNIDTAPGEIGADIAFRIADLMHEATMRALASTSPNAALHRQRWARFFDECAACFTAAAKRLRGEDEEKKDAA